MKNIGKSTRARLAASALAMLLCVAMLVGTTFAWFSDEAKTGETTITAGNLDVALMVEGDEGTFAEATTETKLFDETKPALWEPGVMAVSRAFYVQNNGSLALQYSLSTKVTGDLFYRWENPAGYYRLSNVIKMKVSDANNPALENLAQGATYAQRKEAWESIEGAPIALGGYSSTGVLLPKGYTGEVNGAIPFDQQDTAQKVIVLFWEPYEGTQVNPAENPDNIYNIQGEHYLTDTPTFDFTVDVLATQTPAESDSFGTQYDNIKIVTGQTAFEDALTDIQDGTVVELTDGKYILPETFPDASFTIKGEGKDSVIEIDPTDGKSKGYSINMKDGNTVRMENLTIDGEFFDEPSDGYHGVLELSGNGTFECNNVNLRRSGYNVSTYDSVICATSGAPKIHLNGTEIGGNANRGIFIEGVTGGELIIDGCTISALYPFNVSGSSNPGYNFKIEVKNSTLAGHTSYGEGQTEPVTFENVTFQSYGYGLDAYNDVRGYVDTVFTNCIFAEGFYYYTNSEELTSEAVSVDFVDCVKRSGYPATDTPITADNIREILPEKNDYDDNAKLDVKVNGTSTGAKYKYE